MKSVEVVDYKKAINYEAEKKVVRIRYTPSKSFGHIWPEWSIFINNKLLRDRLDHITATKIFYAEKGKAIKFNDNLIIRINQEAIES